AGLALAGQSGLLSPGAARSASTVGHGQPNPPTYHPTEVHTTVIRAVKRRPPATGSSQPGAVPLRTATTLTTTAPYTMQPTTLCTTTRVEGPLPLWKPNAHGQWYATGSESSRASAPVPRWAVPSHDGTARASLP